MTFDSFKEEVIKAFAPNQVDVCEFGGYFRVRYKLLDGNEIIGFFDPLYDIDIESILEQVNDAQRQGRQYTLFIFKGSEIPEDAFKESGYPLVVIPAGVSEIHNSAFSRCKNLRDISLPVGLESIGMSAFEGCSNLTSISLPEGLTEIGNFAFSYCRGLKSIYLPTSLKEIGASAFNSSGLNRICLPAGLKEIGPFVFSKCIDLRSVHFEGYLKTIPMNAFYGCSSLWEIQLPLGVKIIEKDAFFGCKGLSRLYLPPSVAFIEKYAFAYAGLQKLTLTNRNIIISKNAFYCNSLTEVLLPEGMTWYEAKDKFEDTPWGEFGPNADEMTAKAQKIIPILRMNLELLIKKMFEPYKVIFNTGSYKRFFSFKVKLENGSSVIGEYNLGITKDYTQLVKTQLQSLKSKAENSPDTCFVVGESPSVMDEIDDETKIKHLIFEGLGELEENDFMNIFGYGTSFPNLLRTSLITNVKFFMLVEHFRKNDSNITYCLQS